MGRNNRDQTERMQIYFLSDVLVAVASLNLKVPIKETTRKRNENRDSHYLRPVTKVTKEHLQARNTKRHVGSSWSER